MKVIVKWGKEKFKDIDLVEEETPLLFKSQLQSLTNVPVDRQKVIIKGKMVGDDDEWSNFKLKEGMTITLRGTAEVLVEKTEEVQFIEDMGDQYDVLEDALNPPGLENLGNTCYMNATLQCLNAVDELKQAVKENDPADYDDKKMLIVQLRSLFEQMKETGKTITPYYFVGTFRQMYPQYAETVQGHYVQQDADEFWGELLTVLSTSIKDQNGDAIVKDLFSGEMEVTLTNSETDAEEPKVTVERFMKLSCNITSEVNYLRDGINLIENIEKNSEVLGRNAVYVKKQAIKKLPKYLTVNFVRFFYRQDIGKKQKVLRPVKYPLELDVYEFCSDRFQKALRQLRAKMLEEEGVTGASTTASSSSSSSSSSSNGDSEEKKTEGDGMDVEKEGQEEDDLSEYDGITGYYDLVGVVTHKGRSSDGGHYVGWVKQAENEWVKFDDEKITHCNDQDILKLVGGGDRDVAYTCLYKAKWGDKSDDGDKIEIEE